MGDTHRAWGAPTGFGEHPRGWIGAPRGAPPMGRCLLPEAPRGRPRPWRRCEEEEDSFLEGESPLERREAPKIAGFGGVGGAGGGGACCPSWFFHFSFATFGCCLLSPRCFSPRRAQLWCEDVLGVGPLLLLLGACVLPARPRVTIRSCHPAHGGTCRMGRMQEEKDPRGFCCPKFPQHLSKLFLNPFTKTATNCGAGTITVLMRM